MTGGQVQIFLDGNIPVVIGECPKCHNGDRSLILVDFVSNPVHPNKSTIYVKCMQCTGVYQTNIESAAGD